MGLESPALVYSMEELEQWRSQIVTSNPAAKMGLRRRPFAFTEQGVAMLSSVLRSGRAVLVNVEIMRAFVRLRQILSGHADLARKLAALEQKYDVQFKVVFDAIRQLMAPIPEQKRGKIGFSSPPKEVHNSLTSAKLVSDPSLAPAPLVLACSALPAVARSLPAVARSPDRAATPPDRRSPIRPAKQQSTPARSSLAQTMIVMRPLTSDS
jgi:hypothetical protein